MAYFFYVDKMLLPVAPEKIQLKIDKSNKTYTLINEGEINVLKESKLTDIEFSILLPNVKYPFAQYLAGFQRAPYYLEKLEKLKSEKKPFQFIITRALPNGKMLFDTNMKVSLESYTIKEDSKEGMDVIVTIKLKQYRDYKTKTCNVTFPVTKPNSSVTEKAKLTVQNERPSENAPKTNSHTVVKGDTLWGIAKKYYGDGSKYPVIVKVNNIANPNMVAIGQVLTIPSI